MMQYAPAELARSRFSGSRGKHPEAGFGSTRKSGTRVGESRCPRPSRSTAAACRHSNGVSPSRPTSSLGGRCIAPRAAL
jgi:hypothetical protein